MEAAVSGALEVEAAASAVVVEEAAEVAAHREGGSFKSFDRIYKIYRIKNLVNPVILSINLL